jgi:O-antigen biosynthesis protein WbqP
MKRVFDFLFSILLIIIFFIPSIVIAISIKLTSKGKILYWSDRVGKNNVIFKMPKFRSMKIDTPELATHLLDDSMSALTPIGNFLRRYSLDEIPQLWSIARGYMSFVGPRPALYNQDDLISLRSIHGIEKILPGLTGWAQVNGRDSLPIKEKVEKDAEYLKYHSFLFDLKILWLTFVKVIKKDGVSH